MSKLGIFVDCPSLWHGAFAWAKGNVKAGAKLRVDYKSLLKLLSQHGDPVVKKAYIVTQRGIDILGFKNALEVMGYEAVLVDKRTAREDIRKDLTDGCLSNVDVLVIASDDPMLKAAVDQVSTNHAVHWYSFNLNQKGRHQSHALGAEVVI